MNDLQEIDSVTYYQVVRFVDCCNGTEILFKGEVSVTETNVYQYIGSTTFTGTGGELIPNRCYTVFNELVAEHEPTYPVNPSLVLLNAINSKDCADEACADCNPTGPCECEEGFVYNEVTELCEKTVETTAEYSGNLLPIVAGSKSTAFTGFGCRLYPDITSLTWPLLGNLVTGVYTVLENNGSGSAVIPTNNVQNNAFGSYIPGCQTGNLGGRLNKAGIWATGFPNDEELSFEFCIDIEGAEDKQYMIGIAGDNYVKFYVNGVLAVFLDAVGSPLTPFKHWHTFPLTLSPGINTIKLSGLNITGSAAFAAEIYDITLSNFISNLLIPAVGPGNCGTTEAQLEPYIIFSTRDYVGLSVPDPSVPGVWTCPDGSSVDYCNGTPVCTIVESIALECDCYLIVPCDGTAPFNSNDPAYEIYLNTFIEVSGPEYTGCAYVAQDDTLLCNDSPVTTIPTGVVCDCDLICYFVQGGNGFFYVDENDEFLFISSIDANPYIRICSKILPIPQEGSDIDNFKAIPVGDCVDGFCPDLCFELKSCESGEIIYSNSDVLYQYAFGTDTVIEILGEEGCWNVSLEDDPVSPACECLVDVVVVRSYFECEDCIKIPAYRLNSCTDSSVKYSIDDLEVYIGHVIKTDCGCYEVELIDFIPPNTQSIVIEGSYDDCISCTRIYYELVDCSGISNTIYTYTDLSLLNGQTIKIENCTECWTVNEIINPELIYSSAGEVTVTDSYDTCLECEDIVCECSQVTNYSETEVRTYQYLNCDNETVEIVLQPGESSGRICILKWLPQNASCSECFAVAFYEINDKVIIFTASPTGEFLNGYPTYTLEAFGQAGVFDIYTVAVVNGQWVISLGDPTDLNNILYVLPNEGEPGTCPIGPEGGDPLRWEHYPTAIPGEIPAISGECPERCDCILAILEINSVIQQIIWTFVGYNGEHNAIYEDESGNPIIFNGTSWEYNLGGENYKTVLEDLPCPTGSWTNDSGNVLTSAVSDLCPPLPIVDIPFLSTDFFEVFGECKHGVCPPRTFPNKRVITPGYNTPICTPEKYDMITCNFADVMYNIVLEKRYGITTCCLEEVHKWIVKKELIDLQALKDPDYKCSECNCNSNSTNDCTTCKSKN